VSVVGVLVSGNGSNLQSLLDASRDGRLGAPVGFVLSNKPGVLALERARRAGVPSEALSHREFPSREAFDARVVERLSAHGVDTVVLAGFLRVVTRVLLDAFPQRVVNIHPSLLPAFPGLDAQAQALAHGVKVTGCTVHLVDTGLDSGPILAQRAVAVLPDDTVDTLRDRILAEEHRILPEMVAALVAGRVRLEGRRVTVLPVATGW
jgi:phosphoribosylglycinamide formyltransferase-1